MFFKLKILFYLLQLKVNKKLFKGNVLVFQKKSFSKLKKNVKKSPFYKNYFQKEISEFPLINKSIFMDNFNNINTCNIDKKEAMEIALKAETSRNFTPTINGVTIGLSSGTSGSRGLFLVNNNERARWVAAVLDRVIGFSLKKRKVAFFLRADSNLYNSVQSSILQFNFLDLYTSIDQNVIKLNEIQPDILVAQPSMLVEIAKQVELKNLSISPSKIISVAEVLNEIDKKYLKSTFKQVIHQVYQCTEGFLATSCEYGTLHFNEDLIKIEKRYLDDDQTRFHPVITDFHRESQPVIRYELNDIIIEKKQCKCNSSFMAIEEIVGRSDDMLVFTDINGKTIKLFPDLFRRSIINNDDQVSDYVLTQTSYNKLTLYLNSVNESSFSIVQQAILQLLNNYDIEEVTIDLEKEKKHTIGNKLKRIRNDIRLSN